MKAGTRKAALVVTTIQAPNRIMENLARAAGQAGAPFFVMGDRKSPERYELDGACYLSLAAQHDRFGAFSKALPENHYVRKNLGYLAALESDVEWLLETDDDNDPLGNFFECPDETLMTRRLEGTGWVNVYQNFSPTSPIWPRGFPLQQLAEPDRSMGPAVSVQPRLVQGLANENPDVDAVFRLTRSLPVNFGSEEPLFLGSDQWCPFNSQNTWFHRDIALLMYLPTYCSFRMTDIWRSFVAQRCLWGQQQGVVFTGPSVRQDRNEHNLLRDFEDEVPGYLQNDKIRQVLSSLDLSGELAADMTTCYRALVDNGIFDPRELSLLDQWLAEAARRL